MSLFRSLRYNVPKCDTSRGFTVFHPNVELSIIPRPLEKRDLFFNESNNPVFLFQNKYYSYLSFLEKVLFLWNIRKYDLFEKKFYKIIRE